MPPLRAIAFLFLQLGITAFGGPVAHIAMMHEQIVRRRGWISDAEFTDLLAATNLIPGPNSTELAIHIGRRAAGWRGLLVAGVCFIVPAALIVSALSVAYVRYGGTPDARALLAGVAPVIIAVILQATVQLAAVSLRSLPLWFIAIAATALSVFGVNELLVLVGGGVAMLLARGPGRAPTAALLVFMWTASAAAAAAAPASISLARLTLFFLKVGSVLFGSGYVLIAFLRADLVERWGWLTERQLLDAVAIGQVTPGPVFTTATFVGYVLGGWPGAFLATAAIFLPAFVFVALSQPLIPRLRRSRAAGAFLDGVVASSLGIMAAVAVTLARSTLTAPLWTAVAIAALAALVYWRVNSAWLVLGGAAVGLLLGG
jgi:chromate transporter